MQILYFISTVINDKAAGGHFHSLNQISQELAKQNQVYIYSLGAKPSPVLINNPNFKEHIQLEIGWHASTKLNQRLKTVVRGIDAKDIVVHGFDSESLMRLLVCPALKSIPIVWNKCGGPNPRTSRYQHADETVVFSKENEHWFRSNANYDNQRIHLIPNRVRALSLLPKPARTEKKASDKLTFLRISRLGGAYDKTLRDSFRMIASVAKDYEVEFVVIGRIQNEAIFSTLCQEAKEQNINVRFITDERAANAAQFLYLADIVIGTGRSFMEAASLGIPTMAPAINAEWPVLINQENFDYFFIHNFSERTTVPLNYQEASATELKRILDDPEARRQAGSISKTLFDTYFGTFPIAEKYTKVYGASLERKQARWKLIFKNAPYLIKYHIFGRK